MFQLNKKMKRKQESTFISWLEQCVTIPILVLDNTIDPALAKAWVRSLVPRQHFTARRESFFENCQNDWNAWRTSSFTQQKAKRRHRADFKREIWELTSQTLLSHVYIGTEEEYSIPERTPDKKDIYMIILTAQFSRKLTFLFCSFLHAALDQKGIFMYLGSRPRHFDARDISYECRVLKTFSCSRNSNAIDFLSKWKTLPERYVRQCVLDGSSQNALGIVNEILWSQYYTQRVPNITLVSDVLYEIYNYRQSLYQNNSRDDMFSLCVGVESENLGVWDGIFLSLCSNDEVVALENTTVDVRILAHIFERIFVLVPFPISERIAAARSLIEKNPYNGVKLAPLLCINDEKYTGQGNECVVCMDKKASMAPVPCGHLCLCQSCNNDIISTTKKCPICSQILQGSMRIFVPLVGASQKV